jgi:hypothetical protein
MIGPSPIKTCAQLAPCPHANADRHHSVSAPPISFPQRLHAASASFLSPCPVRDISPPPINPWRARLARSLRCSTGRACGRRRRTRSSGTSSSATATDAGAPSPPRLVRTACIFRKKDLSPEDSKGNIEQIALRQAL